MLVVRRQLPVRSPIVGAALPHAAWAALTRDGVARDTVRATLAGQFGATAVALTDSGTSALILAFRLTIPSGGTVALPAYCCPDILAAAAAAALRVRLYDTDPATLSPDLDSVDRALARGADAIVVAHLYGYPADVPAVRELADRRGVSVIEDAAQHGGGRLRGTPLGGFGPLTVLSFGRGKGTTGGGGGALLAIGAAHTVGVAGRNGGLLHPASGVAAISDRGGERPTPAGWYDLIRAMGQWMAGRPALYGIPAAIPFLHLGETRYRSAGEPAPLSAAAAVLLTGALTRVGAERSARAACAKRLSEMMASAQALEMIRPTDGGEPGYLRFAACEVGGRPLVPAVGVVRGYPRLLDDYAEARLVLDRAESEADATPGARKLSQTLVTLPTHDLLTHSDLRVISAWAADIPKWS